MTKTFRELGVAEPLCAALDSQGILDAFPIQELTLPLALAGNDLIGQARTGTGKTFAFGLPLLQRIDPSKAITQALIVVPTRELCLQVHNDLTIGTTLGVTSIAVYGGVGYDDQIAALEKGAHVVVGTPGRLLDLLDRRVLDLSQVTQLVLDEADEMLDMGFLPDVERLVEACPTEGRHTMLFSATMPTAIVKLGRRYMHHPTFTRADHEQVGTVPTVKQFFFQVHRMDKPRVLARILQDAGRQAVYVFVRTKHMADRLVNELEDLGTPAIAIHGDLRQTTRERNLDRFRSGKATVLVATEVAARGLDVDNVTHVVNYDCPDDDKMYLHRIGRTARAGRDGVAVTFAEHNESERLNVIRKAVGAEQAVVPIFSTSPELAEWFDLPAETPWSSFAADAISARSSNRTGSQRKGAKASRQSSGRSSGESLGQSSGQSAGKASSESSPGQSGRRGQSTSTSRPNGRSTQLDEAASASGDAGTRSSSTRRSRSDGTRSRQAPGNNGSSQGATTASGDDAPKASSDTDARDGAQGDRAPSNGGTARSNDNDAAGARSRTRTRTRQRSTDTSNDASEGSANVTSEGRSSSGRTRARGGSGRSSASQPRGRGDGSAPRNNADNTPRGNGSADGRQGKGGGKQQTSSESSGDPERQGSSRGRDRQETSGSGRNSRDGQSSRGRGQSSRGGSQSSRGSSQSSRGDNGGGGSGDSRGASPSRAVQAPGPEARGEGQPQVARTVKVEHLP
ncbi:MAG: DEAD/DEAH box helicase [Nitriliruptoraceae bacterium]